MRFPKPARLFVLLAALSPLMLSLSHTTARAQGLPVRKGDTICVVGNGLAAGMAEAGFWETLLQSRWTEARLRVRNLANPGDSMDFDAAPVGDESQDAALARLRARTVIALFAPGDEAPSAAALEPELDAWLKHLATQDYDGAGAPAVVLVSPPPCENTGDASLSARFARGNQLRQDYVTMMRRVAADNQAGFIDGFSGLSQKFLGSGGKRFTSNAVDLTTEGYKELGAVVDYYSFGRHPNTDMTLEEARALKAAVLDKSGVFAVARKLRKRQLQDGIDPARDAQLRALDVMLQNRDQRVWDLAQRKLVKGPVDDGNVPAAPGLDALLQAGAAGGAPAAAAPPPRGYSIPLIDLDSRADGRVVVDREPGQYLGHPTTVLLEDNSTLLCVYPKGHGRGPIVYKRSTDAGRTWSERLPTPASWETSLEVPTLHRVIDAEGRKRIILFSGLYPARMAVSEDDGATWSELQPVGDWGGIVVMGSVVALKTPGHYMAMFHDDGRFFTSGGGLQSPVVFRLFTTFSSDGGLTWSFPNEIWHGSDVHLCEPGAIRSPDGSRIAVLLRENSRTRNSFVVFSDDEGRTWSEPRELPGALTGDRHAGRYAPDGRLFLSFRDMAHESPTKGDWVGWVGTYEDIVTGREGQFRVRLKDNTKGSDCAYPGVEILPDGTFVTTTYGHWEQDEAPYILSVRFTLAELDRLAADRQVR